MCPSELAVVVHEQHLFAQGQLVAPAVVPESPQASCRQHSTLDKRVSMWIQDFPVEKLFVYNEIGQSLDSSICSLGTAARCCVSKTAPQMREDHIRGGRISMLGGHRIHGLHGLEDVGELRVCTL